MEGETDSIDFMARCKNWVAIKKMSILGNTTNEEIAFHLAGIRQLIDRKAFEFLNIDTTSLDQIADRLTQGKRGYSGLEEIVGQLGKGEIKAETERATNGKEELGKVASTYIFRKVTQNLGIDFDVNQEMLSKAYPNLKMPKPPGRFKK